MKILLLAPQPFYQERGTPIAVDLVLKTLSGLGHTVDVVTYAEGQSREYPRVRVHRIVKLPGVSNIAPGPSWKKIVCDLFLAAKALQLARKGRYDLVHAVEESVGIALAIRWLLRTPYLYDMDSSMAEQVMDKYPRLRWLGAFFRGWEAEAVRRAEAVVPVCDALADVARPSSPKRMVVLRDISLLSSQAEGGGAPSLRSELGVSGPTVMYVGNLERYQGLDLLLESALFVLRESPDAKFIIVGGNEAGIRRYRASAERLGVAASVFFAGPRPINRLASYLSEADVLVSPRLQGGNTPMKIYSYLDSGIAVVATQLPTHTQVLTPEVAILARPEPQAFAAGILRALRDPGLRRRLGASAKDLIVRRHSYAVFRDTLSSLYQELDRGLRARRTAADATRKDAAIGVAAPHAKET